MFQDDQTALQGSQGRDLIDSAGGIWAEHLGAPACSRPRSSPPQPLNREETRSGAMIDPGYMSLDANMILIAESLISENVQPASQPELYGPVDQNSWIGGWVGSP